MSNRVSSARSVCITLPLPGPELRGNKRGHTRWQPSSYKALQEEAYWLLRESTLWPDRKPFPLDRFTVRYDYHFHGRAMPDPGNTATGMKAALDAAGRHTTRCKPACCLHYGIIKNDGPRCVVSECIFTYEVESAGEVGVRMTITEVI